METLPPVLVIKKHPLMRAAIVNAIADEPNLTIVAITSDGGDMFRIIENLQPEIILFAIGNPGEEDLEKLKELHEHSPNAVVLALTTNEVPGQDQSALEHGANATLTKTVQRAELLHTLRMMKASMKSSEEYMTHVQRRNTG